MAAQQQQEKNKDTDNHQVNILTISLFKHNIFTCG